jgi:hypothetical protein
MEKFVDAVIQIVKASSERLVARIEGLEQRMAGVRDGRDGVPGPPGERGADGLHGKDGAPGMNGAMGLKGDKGDPGADGAKGMDGLHGKDGAPGKDGERGADGPKGEPGADGKPGVDGRDGRDGMPGTPGERGMDGLNGKDGKDGLHGKDGLDGFGFDDLDVVHDGERTVTFTFTKGERVKTFPIVFDVPLFRGVFTEGKSYESGDMVQFGGNMYYAQRATTQKPAENGDGAKDWKLAVRRGREGKEGPRGISGGR